MILRGVCLIRDDPLHQRNSRFTVLILQKAPAQLEKQGKVFLFRLPVFPVQGNQPSIDLMDGVSYILRVIAGVHQRDQTLFGFLLFSPFHFELTAPQARQIAYRLLFKHRQEIQVSAVLVSRRLPDLSGNIPQPGILRRLFRHLFHQPACLFLFILLHQYGGIDRGRVRVADSCFSQILIQAFRFFRIPFLPCAAHFVKTGKPRIIIRVLLPFKKGIGEPFLLGAFVLHILQEITGELFSQILHILHQGKFLVYDFPDFRGQTEVIHQKAQQAVPCFQRRLQIHTDILFQQTCPQFCIQPGGQPAIGFLHLPKPVPHRSLRQLLLRLLRLRRQTQRLLISLPQTLEPFRIILRVGPRKLLSVSLLYLLFLLCGFCFQYQPYLFFVHCRITSVNLSPSIRSSRS